MIVEGQLHGGIAQGIAQALFEEVVYDPETGQLHDRHAGRLPRADRRTRSRRPILDRTVTPSPTNELGVKGIGEAGTIASSVAVINAIVDALSAVRHHPRRHARQPGPRSGSTIQDAQGARA